LIEMFFTRSVAFKNFTPFKSFNGISVKQFNGYSSNKGRNPSKKFFNDFPDRSFSVVPLRKGNTFSGFGFGAALLGAFGLGFLLYQQSDDRKQVMAASSKPTDAALAQSTVVTGCHPHGAFVTIYLSPQADLKAVAKAASKLPTIVSKVTPEGDAKQPGQLPTVMAGVAFSTQIWDDLCGNFKITKPSQGFGHFNIKSGKLGTMPATGGDILLHVKAESPSLCFETVKKFVETLPPGSVFKVDDRYSFQFQDGRDLSGFLDGTENPADDLSRRDAALLPNGGSYIVHQRWVHNLKYFNSLSQGEQEHIIGRTKEDSAELSRDLMRKTAHVTRMRDEKFNKIPIVRQSMPYGNLNEHGLLFIAYSNSVNKFDQMLDQMVGKKNGSETDATMKFSTCVASNYYYIPSLKELSSLT